MDERRGGEEAADNDIVVDEEGNSLQTSTSNNVIERGFEVHSTTKSFVGENEVVATTIEREEKENDDLSRRNNNEKNEVSQMIADALQQIDTVIAGMYIFFLLFILFLLG